MFYSPLFMAPQNSSIGSAASCIIHKDAAKRMLHVCENLKRRLSNEYLQDIPHNLNLSKFVNISNLIIKFKYYIKI